MQNWKTMHSYTFVVPQARNSHPDFLLDRRKVDLAKQMIRGRALINPTGRMHWTDWSL
jgi:hypothetical protein